jgi:L-threonylcarbamoyladenylate synthase
LQVNKFGHDYNYPLRIASGRPGDGQAPVIAAWYMMIRHLEGREFSARLLTEEGSVEVFDCLADDGLQETLTATKAFVGDHHLIILPTDTGYAIGGDAFSAAVTSRIRAIKGMAETAPLQVLISDVGVLDGVASPASHDARLLAGAFWPGPLSMILPASPTLKWDIGGDRRFVQVRVPNNPVAIELLKLTGPMAVSAARAAGTPVIEKTEDIGPLQHHVAAFLDYGTLESGGLSTIVDCTSDKVAILRKGPVTAGQIVDVVNYMPRMPS